MRCMSHVIGEMHVETAAGFCYTPVGVATTRDTGRGTSGSLPGAM